MYLVRAALPNPKVYKLLQRLKHEHEWTSGSKRPMLHSKRLKDTRKRIPVSIKISQAG